MKVLVHVARMIMRTGVDRPKLDAKTLLIILKEVLVRVWVQLYLTKEPMDRDVYHKIFHNNVLRSVRRLKMG